jgi:hypothetical protein
LGGKDGVGRLLMVMVMGWICSGLVGEEEDLCSFFFHLGLSCSNMDDTLGRMQMQRYIRCPWEYECLYNPLLCHPGRSGALHVPVGNFHGSQLPLYQWDTEIFQNTNPGIYLVRSRLLGGGTSSLIHLKTASTSERLSPTLQSVIWGK